MGVLITDHAIWYAQKHLGKVFLGAGISVQAHWRTCNGEGKCRDDVSEPALCGDAVLQHYQGILMLLWVYS